MMRECRKGVWGDGARAGDVTHYAVPLATIQAVMIEMLGAYSQCHSHKQTLRAQITAAEDEAALDAVIIAWPI